jgi:hypothetical protein
MDTPNYNESPVAGSVWTRCTNVTIKNPLGGTPYMLLEEERAFTMGPGETITKRGATLSVSFDVNNPLHMQMYVVCNAIYVEERDKRDAPPPPPPPVEPEEPVFPPEDPPPVP